MRAHSQFGSHFGSRCVPVLACGLAVMVSGCGGRRGAGGLPGDVYLASYDHYFYVGVPEPEEVTEQRIDGEIDRLATPAWKTARENLFRLGKPAIGRLILNLERTEQSSASVRPVPGPTLPEKEQTWPLGYVVYTVLLDFVGNYTNYAGTRLPGFDARDWNNWWAANRKGLVVYDASTTAPGYVMDQLARAELALSTRYRKIAEAVARQKAWEAKTKAKWEQEQVGEEARRKAPAKGEEPPKRKARREKERRRPAAAKPRRRPGRGEIAEEVEVTEEERAKEIEVEEEAPVEVPEGVSEEVSEAPEEPKEEPGPEEVKEEAAEKAEEPEEEKKPSRRGRRRRRR